MAITTGEWVDAVPFRAHLRHLMTVGEMTEEEAAGLTGVSVRVVRHLLRGRGGRVLRRISPDTGHRLLQVSARDVAGLRWCLTPAATARTAYLQLRRRGWSDIELSNSLRLPAAELAQLADGAPRCSRLLSLRLASVVGTGPVLDLPAGDLPVRDLPVTVPPTRRATRTARAA